MCAYGLLNVERMHTDREKDGVVVVGWGGERKRPVVWGLGEGGRSANYRSYTLIAMFSLALTNTLHTRAYVVWLRPPG